MPVIMPFNYKVKQIVMKEKKPILVLCITDNEASEIATLEFAKTKNELKD